MPKVKEFTKIKDHPTAKYGKFLNSEAIQLTITNLVNSVPNHHKLETSFNWK